MNANEQQIQWELSPGEKTVAILAMPSSATDHIVILIHGFMSNKNSETNRALTGRLLANGIATIRFDLFGHGESGSPFQKLTLSSCLRQVEGIMSLTTSSSADLPMGYKKIGVVGSSFGGLIAIHTAARYPDITSLALRCPVSNYPAIWQSRLSKEGLAQWKQDGQLSFMTEEGKATLEYSYYEDLLRHDTYRAAAQIKTPTIVVHGDADVDVPVDQSIRLFDTLRLSDTRKRFIQMPGADHAFSKESDFAEMIRQIEAWLVSNGGSAFPTPTA